MILCLFEHELTQTVRLHPTHLGRIVEADLSNLHGFGLLQVPPSCVHHLNLLEFATLDGISLYIVQICISKVLDPDTGETGGSPVP